MWSTEVNKIRSFIERWPSSASAGEDLDNWDDVVPRRHNSVMVGSNYKLKLDDVEYEVFDWIYCILEEKKCPYSLAVTLANVLSKRISEEMSQRHNTSNGGVADVSPSCVLADELYQEVVTKLDELCNSYKSDPEEVIKLSMEHSSTPFVSSVSAVKNGRRKMEDRHVILHNLNSLFGIKSNKQYSYYAVFDGHAGVDAATYTASHLHLNLIKSESFKDGDIKAAIREAFSQTDLYYLERSAREGIKSGSTAVCCLFEGKEKLFLAWLGDSQAILVKNGRPHDVMNPHKPEREDERCRIEQMGGMVSCIDTWRVNGTLAVSRAIGDPEHKPYVCSEPDIEEIQLDGTEDFLILACDGLWDQITPEEATTIVYEHLAENKSSNLNEAAEKMASVLIENAKNEGSTDNITVIVLFLRDIELILKTPFTPSKEQNSNPFINDVDFNENRSLYCKPFETSAAHLGNNQDLFDGNNEQTIATDETYSKTLASDSINFMEPPTPPVDEGSNNLQSLTGDHLFMPSVEEAAFAGELNSAEESSLVTHADNSQFGAFDFSDSSKTETCSFSFDDKLVTGPSELSDFNMNMNINMNIKPAESVDHSCDDMRQTPISPGSPLVNTLGTSVTTDIPVEQPHSPALAEFDFSENMVSVISAEPPLLPAEEVSSNAPLLSEALEFSKVNIAPSGEITLTAETVATPDDSVSHIDTIPSDGASQIVVEGLCEESSKNETNPFGFEEKVATAPQFSDDNMNTVEPACQPVDLTADLISQSPVSAGSPLVKAFDDNPLEQPSISPSVTVNGSEGEDLYLAVCPQAPDALEKMEDIIEEAEPVVEKVFELSSVILESKSPICQDPLPEAFTADDSKESVSQEGEPEVYDVSFLDEEKKPQFLDESFNSPVPEEPKQLPPLAGESLFMQSPAEVDVGSAAVDETVSSDESSLLVCDTMVEPLLPVSPTVMVEETAIPTSPLVNETNLAPVDLEVPNNLLGWSDDKHEVVSMGVADAPAEDTCAQELRTQPIEAVNGVETMESGASSPLKMEEVLERVSSPLVSDMCLIPPVASVEADPLAEDSSEKPKAETEPDLEPKPEPYLEPKPESDPEPKPESDPEPKPESDPEPKPELDSEPKPELEAELVPVINGTGDKPIEEVASTETTEIIKEITTPDLKLKSAPSKPTAAVASAKTKQLKTQTVASKTATSRSPATGTTASTINKAPAATARKTTTSTTKVTTSTVSKSTVSTAKSTVPAATKKVITTAKPSASAAPKAAAATTRPATATRAPITKAAAAPTTNGVKSAEKKAEPARPKTATNLSTVTSRINSRPPPKTATAQPKVDSKASPKTSAQPKLNAKPATQVNGSSKPASTKIAPAAKVDTKKPSTFKAPSTTGRASLAPSAPATKPPMMKRSAASASLIGTKATSTTSTRTTSTTASSSSIIKRRSTSAVTTTSSSTTTTTTATSTPAANGVAIKKISRDVKSSADSKLAKVKEVPHKRDKNSVNSQNSLKAELEAALEKASPVEPECQPMNNNNHSTENGEGGLMARDQLVGAATE